MKKPVGEWGGVYEVFRNLAWHLMRHGFCSPREVIGS